MIKLYKHQQELIDLNPKKHLLSFDTGTGKTLASIYLANKNIESVLVVVPKSLKEQWVREMHKYSTTGWQVISKEEFRRDWDKLGQYNGIIIDEAHFFAGMKSQMSKALLAYNKKWNVEYIWLLTATPYMSTPFNIYRLAQILGLKWNYWSFEGRFFDRIPMGGRVIPVLKKGMEGDVAKLVKSLGTTVHINECADVPEQSFINEYFVLNKKQEKAIKDIKADESNPAVRYMRTHQIENGTLKSDGYTEDQFFPCDKHDRIMELINEHKKIAIFCKYNLEIDSLADQCKSKGHKVYVIRGDVKDRDAVIRAVEESEECVVIINAACSEGYELPSIPMIIFASLSFSYKDYKQACGRFLRINKLKKNVYLHLVNQGTVDEAVYQSIMSKQDFSLAIYSKKYDK